jgi:hypothetical protein
MEKLIGRIPYLNGGMFEQHDIEKRYGDEIQIPDKAFERIFDYFDQYQWHLDERPLRADNEINPDVLGYIFEKYINQKRMGAYYTKEDITEYIGKNTVLPFLFDAARPKCKIAFENPNGPTIWDLLRENPDRYIFDAVKKGVENSLPKEIRAGIKDVSKRDGWNKPASGEFALPTEIWREVVARHQRYADLKSKLTNREITSINDLVTLNLDIRQFAQDVIEHCEGPELLRAFWHAVEKVTILDPTCGSGAFLFAALNILEPLYEACLDRMEAFVAELDRSGEKHRPEKFSDFRAVLERVAAHPSRRYFIFKSIILNNLFGVDIMEEAVEICKLRLFLKLAAQVEPDVSKENIGIEPLPDIDFNIRAGNTLVGYATADEVKRCMKEFGGGQMRLGVDDELNSYARFLDRLQIADAAWRSFRQQQTELGGRVTVQDKAELKSKLKALEGELNRYLAGDYGVKADDKSAYAKWVKSHQPFHWFVEFYGIVSNGGFDVIIGNPPYFDLKQVLDYKVKNYATLATKNLYPLLMERSIPLATTRGRLGFIVPVSSISTEGYTELQNLVLQLSGHFSSYDDRPSRLFDGLEHIQLTIHLLENTRKPKPDHFVTECYRWSAVERPNLFPTLEYESIETNFLPGCVPKLSSRNEHSVLNKIWNDGKSLGEQTFDSSDHKAFYSRKVHNFLQVLDFIPKVYDGNGKLRPPSELKALTFSKKDEAMAAFCLLNSTLFRWFINVFSDCRHVNKREVQGFRCNLQKLLEKHRDSVRDLGAKLSKSLDKTSEFRKMKFKHDSLRVQCIIPKHSKPVIDEIDRVLARHYGFTAEELDFILNYDIKYRLGRDPGEDE